MMPEKLQFSLRTILEIVVVVGVVLMLVLQTMSRPAAPANVKARYQTFIDDKIVYLTDTWTGEVYTANMRTSASPT